MMGDCLEEEDPLEEAFHDPLVLTDIIFHTSHLTSENLSTLHNDLLTEEFILHLQQRRATMANLDSVLPRPHCQ